MVYRDYPQTLCSGYDDLRGAELFINLGFPLEGGSNVSAILRLALQKGARLIETDTLDDGIFAAVKSADKAVILLGDHPSRALALSAAVLCDETGAKMLVPSGACDARALASLLSGAEEAGEGQVLFIFGDDPVGLGDESARELISSAAFFVVLDSVLTQTAQLADIFIPIGDFTEKEGTYLSQFGVLQSFRSAVRPQMDSRDIIRVISGYLEPSQSLSNAEQGDFEAAQ